jgi:hypothetical protein
MLCKITPLSNYGPAGFDSDPREFTGCTDSGTGGAEGTLHGLSRLARSSRHCTMNGAIRANARQFWIASKSHVFSTGVFHMFGGKRVHRERSNHAR